MLHNSACGQPAGLVARTFTNYIVMGLNLPKDVRSTIRTREFTDIAELENILEAYQMCIRDRWCVSVRFFGVGISYREVQ